MSDEPVSLGDAAFPGERRPLPPNPVVPEPVIPDPRKQPTMLLTEAGKVLGLGRSTSYELARAGEFPVPVIHVRGSYRVPTMGIVKLLDLVDQYPGLSDKSREL